MIFQNTHNFSPAARTYIRSGYYTDALNGTKEYYEFWDTERNRCMYGFEVSGIRITGYHYFYLNYCPIDRAVDEVC